MGVAAAAIFRRNYLSNTVNTLDRSGSGLTLTNNRCTHQHTLPHTERNYFPPTKYLLPHQTFMTQEVKVIKHGEVRDDLVVYFGGDFTQPHTSF